MSPFLDAWRHSPTHRKVWALAAPMILSNISVPMVALVDSAVVGHLPHAHQLGAVAVGSTLYTLMIGVLGFLRRAWGWQCCWRCCWACWRSPSATSPWR
jgi:MATE family multidrug resistance protein